MFENREFECYSFFHSLAHVTFAIRFHEGWDELDEYDQEALLWKYAFKLAKENDVTFSVDTINWGKKQLESFQK